MDRPTPPRRGSYSANPTTTITHTHTPLTLRPQCKQTYAPSGQTAHLQSTRTSCSFVQRGSRSNRGWPGHRTPRPRPDKPVAEDTEAQTAPQPAQHISPRLALHPSRASQTKPSPVPKSRSCRPRLTRRLPSLRSPAPPLSASPFAGPHHRHLELPHSASTLQPHRASHGMPEYGFSGPLELPRPPRPILIRRPLPRQNIISKATPGYPDPKATSQSPQHPHHASPGALMRALRASPGSGKT